MILVMGFGPFGEVTHNPAQQLALAVDEALDGLVIGREMPVSYRRSIETTIEAVQRYRPKLLLGVGVARARTQAELEVFAHCEIGPVPDIDGKIGELKGPTQLRSTLPAHTAGALGVEGSTDAGTYVCNAWLYTLLTLDLCPVGFLHVPNTGFPPERLIRAFADLSKHPMTPRVG